MRTPILLVCLCGLALNAQTPPAPPVDAVKQALTLTDAQITQLQQLRQSARTAAEPILTQIRTRQQTLDQAMQQTAPDPLTVGRLMVEIKSLHEQIRTNDQRFSTQAVALLTTEQKTKLKTLEDASNLRAAIGQASALNLLQPPEDGGPGLGGPRGFGGPGPGGPGAERMRRPGGPGAERMRGPGMDRM